MLSKAKKVVRGDDDPTDKIMICAEPYGGDNPKVTSWICSKPPGHRGEHIAAVVHRVDAGLEQHAWPNTDFLAICEEALNAGF